MSTQDCLNVPVHIVASDLDGTLLAPNHTLSEKTKSVLCQLHDKGFTFVFATGRHHIDVNDIRATAGIPAYMITSNGARVHSPDNVLMSSVNIATQLVQSIVDMVKAESQIKINIYRDDDWLINVEDTSLRSMHKDSGFRCQVFDHDQAPVDGVAKIFLVCHDYELLCQYENKLNQLYGDHLAVAFSLPHCLEVMAANVSKGHSLKLIANSLNLKLDNCIAFGDGMNDVEMLSMAQKGLIMGNAHSRLKQKLVDHQVIASNQDDGVAEYLLAQLL